MSFWLFQSNPSRWDFKEHVTEGEIRSWLVSRYKDEISAGDTVFYWLSGNRSVRGIHGIGEVTDSELAFDPKWGDMAKVRCNKIFSPHIPFTDVSNLPSMKSHLIFKMAIGTNFKLTDSQGKEINNLIQSIATGDSNE